MRALLAVSLLAVMSCTTDNREEASIFPFDDARGRKGGGTLPSNPNDRVLLDLSQKGDRIYILKAQNSEQVFGVYTDSLEAVNIAKSIQTELVRVVPQPMNWNLNLFKQGWRYYEVRILVDATLTGLGTRITDKQLNNYQYQWFTTSEVQGRVVTVYAVGDSEEMAYSEARKFVRLLQQAGAAI